MNVQRVLAALATGFIVASSASAAPVYLISSGQAALDQLFVSKLAEAGHGVTIGPAWYQFSSGKNLPSGGVVLLLAGPNWNTGTSMPASGQSAILNYVNQGGGLITAEWVMWWAGSGTPGSSFAVLNPAFVVMPTGGNWRTTSTLTITQVEADPVINAGLAANISFVPDNFAGTESRLTPKPGAHEFYHSDTYGSSLVGGSYGRGRVAQFSTCIGSQQLNNAGFARLLGNVVTWASSGAACVADQDDGSGAGTPDGGVTIDDLLYYLAIFEAGLLRADVDDGSGTGAPDGGVTIDDLLYYLQRFEAGC